MCKLTRATKANWIDGWKVVAKRDDKYYSVAMGFEYKDGEDIPIVESRIIAIPYFREDLLTSEYYNSSMRGRTAVFKSLRDMEYLFLAIKKNKDAVCPNTTYEVVGLKVRISKDLLKGNYEGAPVIVGRRMKILEEF